MWSSFKGTIAKILKQVHIVYWLILIYQFWPMFDMLFLSYLLQMYMINDGKELLFAC